MPKKLKLTWKGYYEYYSQNVEKYTPDSPGVYKISFLQSDDTLKVRYVGQAIDLSKRLKEHLDLNNEENECLARRLRKYHAEFSFAVVINQENRDGAERALYKHYKPKCNDPDAIPNGPEIEINPK